MILSDSHLDWLEKKFTTEAKFAAFEDILSLIAEVRAHRKMLTEAPVVLGGPDFGCHWEIAMKNYPCTLGFVATHRARLVNMEEL